MQYAIKLATGRPDLSYLNSNPLPTSEEIKSAFALFNPGEQAPPQHVVDSLLTLAGQAREANKPLDPWRYVLLTICYDTQWQVN